MHASGPEISSSAMSSAGSTSVIVLETSSGQFKAFSSVGFFLARSSWPRLISVYQVQRTLLFGLSNTSVTKVISHMGRYHCR